MRRPNGTGSVYKLHGKRRKPYAVAVSYYDDLDDCKLKQKTLGTYATKREALRKLEEYNANPFDVSENFTFADVFNRWSERVFQKGSPQKKASYIAAFKKCKPLHDMPMCSIKLIHLQNFFDSLKGLSRSTLNNVRLVVSGIFEYCMKYDLIPKDYSKFIELPESSEKKEKKIFSDIEIKQLWDIQAENDTAAIVLILIYTGYRVTELLEMPKSNIQLAKGCIIGGGKKTKASKDRIVPIHSVILPLMYRMLEKSKGSFTFYSGTYATFKKEFESLCEEQGFEHTIHETRHTFASMLDRAKVPESITKRLMGHTFGDVTQDVYIHKELDELKEGIEKIQFCQ